MPKQSYTRNGYENIVLTRWKHAFIFKLVFRNDICLSAFGRAEVEWSPAERERGEEIICTLFNAIHTLTKMDVHARNDKIGEYASDVAEAVFARFTSQKEICSSTGKCRKFDIFARTLN